MIAKRALASTVSILAVLGTMCLGSFNAFAEAGVSPVGESSTSTKLDATETSIPSSSGEEQPSSVEELAESNSSEEAGSSETAEIPSSVTDTSSISSSSAPDEDADVVSNPTEVPVHTDGTLFYSRDNDYFSFVGADDPHQDAVQFKKSGYYDLVEYSCEHDLTTGEYSNVKLKSILDGTSYANETKMKKAKGTEYSAGDKFTVGRRGAYLLLYKASETDAPSVFIVVTDKSGTSASSTISCARTELGENYAEYEFTIQYWGTNARINSVNFSKDGSVFSFEQSTKNWGSPCTFRKRFYANGTYEVTAFFNGGSNSRCTFAISGIDEGAVIPTSDTEDSTPPRISYSVSPNATGLTAGRVVTVTVTTDEPAIINFNGMTSDNWVTSWDFPVYTNGSWLCAASDRDHNGNSTTIDVTNFGDGTTTYSEEDEPGNPLESHDPDEFWNDVDSDGAYGGDGRRVRNERLRRTRGSSKIANLMATTLPQTGIKVWHLGLSLLLLAGGIIAIKKSNKHDSTDTNTDETDEKYTPILDEEKNENEDEYHEEKRILNKILEDPQNGIKDGEDDER